MKKNDKKVPNLPPGNTGLPKPAQKGKVKAKANQPIVNPDASKPVPKGKVKAAPKLPVGNAIVSESASVEIVVRNCENFMKKFPDYGFKNWIEYYKAWVEFGSKDANKNVYWNPHKYLPKQPHWNIRYHPESLKSLQDTSEKPMKKLIECVLRLSWGKFSKEIISKQYLKITTQTGNGLWLTAMAGFIVTSAEKTTLKGFLIVISSSTKKAEAEKIFQNIAKSNDFFLDVENVEELLELTTEGSILPKKKYIQRI